MGKPISLLLLSRGLISWIENVARTNRKWFSGILCTIKETNQRIVLWWFSLLGWHFDVHRWNSYELTLTLDYRFDLWKFVAVPVFCTMYAGTFVVILSFSLTNFKPLSSAFFWRLQFRFLVSIFLSCSLYFFFQIINPIDGLPIVNILCLFLE